MVISTSFVFERKLSIDHLVEGVDGRLARLICVLYNIKWPSSSSS